MKKKPDESHVSKSYRDLRLFRDDLDLVISIFKEHNFEIKISDQYFEYETLDELIEKRGERPRSFVLVGQSRENEYGWVSISFEKNRTYLSTSFGNEKTRYAFGRIKDIFDTERSKVYVILNPFLLIIPAYFFGLFYVLKLADKAKQNTVVIPLWLPVIAIVFISIWVISGLYRIGAYQAVLKRKHEGGFWKRNADKIILLVIGAIIGIVAKYVIELLIGK